jgi:hypothetical protein
VDQAEYLESDLGNISDYYKKMEEIENEQGNYIDDDSGPQYHIWKFTRGDVAVMLIGGILGGVFSDIITQIFFK